MDIAHIAEIVAEVGATGALIWLLYHIFTKTLPAMQKAFTKALETTRTDFRDEMRLEREAHQREVERIFKANGAVPREEP